MLSTFLYSNWDILCHKWLYELSGGGIPFYKPQEAKKWNEKPPYSWDDVSKFTSCCLSARPGEKVKDVSTLLNRDRLPGRALKGMNFE